MAGPGFPAFPALWFGPYGSTTANPVPPAAGFLSFQSVWFGPDAGTGDGGSTPAAPVTGRKLISPAFSGTLHGEFT